MSELKSLQRAFTEHLRDPDHVPVPAGLDQRRMGMYSELIFSNVSSLLSDFFPVIHRILSVAQWNKMVRDFFIAYQSQTPYFIQLAGEFVEYLCQRQIADDLPDFLIELAHYEWMELALFTHPADSPLASVDEDTLGEVPLSLTPLARPLAYQYPVHQISAYFQPTKPAEQAIHLLVIRDASESVRFFELQPMSYQLLQQIHENPGTIANVWLANLARDSKIEDSVKITQFVTNGTALLKSFNQHRIFISG